MKYFIIRNDAWMLQDITKAGLWLKIFRQKCGLHAYFFLGSSLITHLIYVFYPNENLGFLTH